MNPLDMFKLSAEELAQENWVNIRRWCEAHGHDFNELTARHARFRMLRAETRAKAMMEAAAKQPPTPAPAPATLVHFKDVSQWWDAKTQRWLKPNIVYIGRAMPHLNVNLPASPYGNPFRIDKDTDDARVDAIDMYLNWIELPAQAHLLRGLDALRGKMLVCFCHPRRCHGDVLIDLMRAKPSYADVADEPRPNGEGSDQYQPMLNMDAF